MKYHNRRLISTALSIVVKDQFVYTCMTDNDNDLFKFVLPCYFKVQNVLRRSTQKDPHGPKWNQEGPKKTHNSWILCTNDSIIPLLYVCRRELFHLQMNIYWKTLDFLSYHIVLFVLICISSPQIAILKISQRIIYDFVFFVCWWILSNQLSFNWYVNISYFMVNQDLSYNSRIKFQIYFYVS